MTGNRWVRLGAALSVVGLLGCMKGEQAKESADSTARNLTLAPTESTAAMKDVPVPTTFPAMAPIAAPPPTFAASAAVTPRPSITVSLYSTDAATE